MTDKEKRDKIKLTYKLNWDKTISKSMLDYNLHRLNDEIIDELLKEAQEKRDNINSHKIIEVGLYGGKSIFGGKEEKIRARTVRCKKYNSCSLYKDGLCRMQKCEHSITNDKIGYTSRARKYYEFKREWQQHEMYNKLKTSYKKMWLIETTLYWDYSNIQLDKNKKLETYLRFMSGGVTKIETNDLTLELLKNICEIGPTRSYISGNSKVSDHDKTVTDFLINIKQVLPKLYKEFICKYPKYNKEMNYVGKEALIHTINVGDVRLSSNVTGYWDGEFITVKDNKPIWAIGKELEEIITKAKPKNTVHIEITRNNQVNEKTKFTD